jgi:hypothetical protein
LNDETTDNTAEIWTDFLGVRVGEQIVIIPAGSTSQMIQGELLALAFDYDDQPVALQIRQNELMPPVTVLWHSILMITVPGAIKKQDEPSDVDLAAVVASMDEQGIPVPAEVRASLDRQNANSN